MGKRNYERLDIETFGRHLITTGDLDPVYIALSEFDDTDLLNRWLVAYWCFYHAGAASYLAEKTGKEFWEAMMVAAKNEEPAPTGGRWPRGHERRHFRGKAATGATKLLWGKYFDKPEGMVMELLEPTHGKNKVDFLDISNAAQTWPLFGPWIGFKVADMLERIHSVPIDFTEAAVFMFKDPTKAALMLWRQKLDLDENAKPKDEAAAIHEVVEYLTKEFSDLNAPPHRDRPVGLQEVETVLCKWKSHMNGHYPLFNDIDEITAGCLEWEPHSEVARLFNHGMPEGTIDIEGTDE